MCTSERREMELEAVHSEFAGSRHGLEEGHKVPVDLKRLVAYGSLLPE
jgi:hypothetical protein